MSFLNKKSRAVIAATAMVCATSAFAQVEFDGAGQRSTLDCDGGQAIVSGASNELTITGPCNGLTLQGASNIIRIDLTSAASISVEGASNEIIWTAPSGSKPKIRSVGAANQIYRAR